MKRRMKRWRLAEDKASVASFVLREIDGNDELEASRNARARQALTEQEAAAHLLDECVRISIVAVQPLGEEALTDVPQPYEPYTNWNAYTRSLALLAFQSMNDVSREDVAAFRAGAEDWAGPAANPEPAPPPSGEYQRPKPARSTRSSSPAAP